MTPGAVTLGPMSSWRWREDPRMLGIVLARYKFVAKLLAGRGCVLEIGCGDGMGARVVRQETSWVVAIDTDAAMIAEAQETEEEMQAVADENGQVHRAVQYHRMTWPVPMVGSFAAAYALDVLEHVPAGAAEDRWLSTMAETAPVGIIGMPSLESQGLASWRSKAGHVNCKTGADLRATMQRHYREVFLFCMNDEVVHVGHPAMAHYLIAMGVR